MKSAVIIAFMMLIASTYGFHTINHSNGGDLLKLLKDDIKIVYVVMFYAETDQAKDVNEEYEL